MPYSGIGDDKLPKAVSKLPKHLRAIWVAAFNASYDPEDEGKVFRIAWAAVRDAQQKKEHEARVMGVKGVKIMTEKAINLGAQQDELRRRLMEAFPGLNFYVYELYDEYAIVVMHPEFDDMATDRPGELKPSTFWKIPYTVTWQPVEGDPNGLQVLDQVTWTPRPQWVRMLPTFVQLKAFDQTDGRTRWLGISSGGFADRDGELVSTALLEAAIHFADKAKLRGTLNVWHIPGSDIGTCDYQALVNGFLLESGLFDDTPAGRSAAVHMKEHGAEYGMSIEFLWANKTAAGVYEAPGIILRRSILPAQAAAFPWSAIALKELDSMTVKINDDKRKALVELVGAEEAERMLAGLDAGAEALKAAGVRFKEAAAAEKPNAAGTQEPEPAVTAKEQAAPASNVLLAAESKPVPLPEFNMVLDEVALKEISGRVSTALSATLEPIMGVLETLRAVTQKMSADVELLKRTDAQKVAEQVRDLPRATVKAIQRPTQQLPAATADQVQVSLEEIGRHTLYGS